MRRALVLLLLLASAAPAQAARTWGPPEPIVDQTTSLPVVAVAPDGSTVRAWSNFGEPFLQFDNAPVIAMGARHVQRVAAASGGQAAVAWAEGAAPDDRTVVALARANGTLGDAVDIGPGVPARLEMNAAGDAAVLTGRFHPVVGLSPAEREYVGFRAAGESFGAGAALPPGTPVAFALAPTGEALVVLGRDVSALQTELDVVSRAPDGTVTEPLTVTDAGPDAALALDAHGRALAAWTDRSRRTLFTALRGTNGVWSPPVARALGEPVAQGTLVAGSGDAGDAVPAWRDAVAESPVSSAAVRLSTGSLATGVFAEPISVPASTDFARLKLRTAPDGTTLIAWLDSVNGVVRVLRRDGTGPFAPPQTAVCAEDTWYHADIAGIGANGTATLQVHRFLVRDAFAAAEPEAPACGAPPATPPAKVSFSRRPVTGRSVTVRVNWPAPDGDDVVGFRFDLDGDGTFDGLTRRGRRTFTFARPGLQQWAFRRLRRSQRFVYPGYEEQRAVVDVFARPTLRVRAGRGVLHLRANAFVGEGLARVVFVARSRGAVVGRRTALLGARPSRRRLALRTSRGRVRVELRQDGRVLRRARVRL